MPAEAAIPHLAGIDIYGRSIPAGLVGGDLVEYINFQQRYNIDSLEEIPWREMSHSDRPGERRFLHTLLYKLRL
jgi:hypothetical protein